MFPCQPSLKPIKNKPITQQCGITLEGVHTAYSFYRGSIMHHPQTYVVLKCFFWATQLCMMSILMEEKTHTHTHACARTHTHSHTHSHTHNDTLYELHKLTCTDLIALTSFLLSSVFNILLTCVCTKFDLKRISLTHIPRVHTSIQKSNRTIYPCMHNTHEHTHTWHHGVKITAGKILVSFKNSRE